MSALGRPTGSVVRSLEAREGELRFVAELAGQPTEIWLRSSLPVVGGADAALALTLIPAMLQGAELRIEAPVDPELLHRAAEIQAVLRSWQRRGDWPPAAECKQVVPVVCDSDAPPPANGGGRVAAFFSGGVDSLYTALSRPEIDDLIYVSGFDVPLAQRELDARVRASLGEAASLLGKRLVTVETNVRALDRFVNWQVWFGSVIAGVARMHAGEYARVHIATGLEYDSLRPSGSHPLLDHLWSTDGMALIHDGAEIKRVDKLRALADDPAARCCLRVCWQNLDDAYDDAYNCGRCEKCLRTAVALECLGVREHFRTLPEALDLDRIAAMRPADRPERDYWTENLELAIERHAGPTMTDALHRFLANATVPARPPPAVPAGRATAVLAVPELRPMLYVDPASWSRLAGRRSFIFVTGSYDGSGNFGDVAQVQATLELLAKLGDDVAVAPVIDMRYLDSHRRGWLRATANFDPADVLVYASPGTHADVGTDAEGLVPFVLPGAVRHTATYLSGGGYLNLRWAQRMLTILEAIEAVCLRAGFDDYEIVSSGLQIEPGWARAAAERAPLRRLRRIGVRDELSAQAAKLLAGADGSREVVLTGDDAVGLIAAAIEGERGNGGRSHAASTDRLPVNLHVGAHTWVSDDPDRLLDYLLRFLAGLGEATGRELALQPVIVYDDGRISERPALERLLGTMRERELAGGEAEPLDLAARDLTRGLATLRRAELTVGSSYHVALSSLLAGVPVALVNGNHYYAQKAEGLRRDFTLGSTLLLDPEADPGGAAREVASTLARADGELDQALRRDAATVIERRRLAAESILELLREDRRRALSGDDAGGRGVSEAEYRSLLDVCARRSANARELERRIAELERLASDHERLIRAFERSASWRVMAPLRRAKAVLGRRNTTAR